MGGMTMKRSGGRTLTERTGSSRTMKTTVKLALGVLAAAVVLAGLAGPAHATFILFDEGVNHPELDWKFVETEHFVIYYYPEVETTARAMYKIAEDVYENDSKLFNFNLRKKVNIVIIDTEDYSNGWAANNFDWVTIWASNLYYPHRGRTNWLRDVFSHEFGHIISLKSASRYRESMVGVLVGGSRTSRKFNFDAGVGVMFGSEALPTWMVEGVAQYNSSMYGGDLYDSHREMLLRTAVLDDHMLTMDQMDIIYDKNGLQAEMVYNQGYAMNLFIGETWGLDYNTRVWHETALGVFSTYNRAIKKELGIDREVLYQQYKSYLTSKYNKQVAGILGNEAKGFKMKPWHLDPPDAEMTDIDKWNEGLWHFHVQYSPNGEYLSMYSRRWHGAKDAPGIYLQKTKPDAEKLNDGKIFTAIPGAVGLYSWSPDSKKIVYSKGDADEYRGYYYNDLYVYDVASKKSDQITRQLRASEPAWSPKNDQIAFIINKDGSQKLAVMRYPKMSGHYMLVDYNDLTQIGNPVWSPDGSKLMFFMYRNEQQDIWTIDADGRNLRPLTYDHWDDRDPCWAPDGKSVFFASDRTGIFNIYRLDLETRELFQITDVVSGAFFPNVKADGSVLTYSYFTSWGYRPFEMPKELWKNKKVENFEFTVTDAEVERNLATSDPLPEINGVDYDVFDGFAQILPVMKDHRGTWVWVPIVDYSDSRLQAGAQILLADAVDSNLLFLYITVGEEQRYSVFYENYMLPFTTFLSLHRIFPQITDNFQVFDFDIKANFDASFYFIGFRYTLMNVHNLSLYYAYQDIRVEQPNNRTRQMTGRALNLGYSTGMAGSSGGFPDGGINPRGKSVDINFAYASPDISEPFTGAKMGTDLADFYSDPSVISINEARHYQDSNYLLPDYGYFQVMANIKNYKPFPFWNLNKLNNWFPIDGWDWEKLNFERWRRARHTLALKGMFGYTHSTVPEGYGYGNSFGRVNFYDRFHGGGMFITGLGAFSDNGAFLGYENYSLEGETMAIVGFDYRFPLIREIDQQIWAFYFDKLYFAFFANTGNYWSHVARKKDMFDANKVFDKTGDGKFSVNDDLLSDAGIELRLSMFLFQNSWDSFFKIAHGFQDKENDERPLRFYVGLGTGFDD